MASFLRGARLRPALWLACALLASWGCSRDPDPREAPSSSTAASGGSGGSGGAPAEGGAPVAPEIVSLVAAPTKVTALDTIVVFSAVVSDPQGVEDIAGGILHHGNPNTPFGAFEPIDAAGGYELALLIDAGGTWPEMATAYFLIAEFRDHAGNVAERSVAIQFDLTGCSQEPDYDSCRACFCALDPVGCESYAEREYHHLYCGNACSQKCSVFCRSVYDGQPNPSLIDPLCEACQPSPRDISAFQDSCLADIPACFGFLVDLGQCPP